LLSPKPRTSQTSSPTAPEYIDIATPLAQRLPRLRELRQNLRQMSIDHGPADSRRFERDLKRTYTTMVKDAERGCGTG
jgi:hypothetical protein